MLGAVRDERGRPVDGADITVWPLMPLPASGLPGSPPERRAKTNGQGYFEVARLATGTYAVLANREGQSARSRVRVDPQRGSPRLSLILRPSRSLEGRVVGPSGKPVAGAWIGMTRADPWLSRAGRELTGFVAAAYSGKSGVFMIPNLGQHAYRLHAIAEDAAVGTSDAVNPGDADITITLAPSRSFSGTVVHAESGNSLPGARVFLRGPSGESHETVSNDVGEFAFRRLLGAVYALDATWESLLLADGAKDEYEIKTDIANARVALTPGGVIEGRVYDKDTGEGMGGVFVRGTIAGTRGSEETPSASTGLDGRYRIERLRGGQYGVTVWSRGGSLLFDDGRMLAIRTGTEFLEVDFGLVMGVRVMGAVVDSEGNPVRNAEVYSRPLGAFREESGPQGRFSIESIFPGASGYLFAHKSGHFGKSKDKLDLPETGSLEGIQIVLRPGGRLGGEVVDAAGQTMQSGPVRIQGNSGQGFSLLQADVVDGRFESRPIPGGPYSLSFADTHGRRGPVEALRLDDGASRGDIVLFAHANTPAGNPALSKDPSRAEDSKTRMSRPVRISGTVFGPKGEMLEGVGLEGLGPRGGAGGVTDRDGRFELRFREGGRYTVKTSSKDFTNDSRVVDVSRQSRITLRLKALSAIVGQVRQANGAAVDRFDYRIEEAEDGGMASALPDAWVSMVSSAGEFGITGIQARRPYRLGVKAEGFAPTWVDVRGIAPGMESAPQFITLRRGARIEGEVVDARGNPVSGVNIQVREPLEARTRSDSEGKFLLDGLSAENVTLLASHGSYVPAVFEISLSPGRASRARITLEEGASLHGTVTAGGQPVEGAQVWLDSGLLDGMIMSATTDSDGAYDLRNVPPGITTVSLRAEGGMTQDDIREQVADLVAGTVTEVDFVLGGGGAVLEGVVSVKGAAPSRGRITVELEAPSGLISRSADLDAEGAYRVEGLESGMAIVTAYALVEGDDRFRTLREEVEIVDGEASTQNFIFATTATLRGVLTGLGDGERGTLVLLAGDVSLSNPTPQDILELQGLAVAMTESGPEGNYSFDAIEPGAYTIVGAAMRGAPQSVTEFLTGIRYVTAVFEVPFGGDFDMGDLSL